MKYAHVYLVILITCLLTAAAIADQTGIEPRVSGEIKIIQAASVLGDNNVHSVTLPSRATIKVRTFWMNWGTRKSPHLVVGFKMENPTPKDLEILACVSYFDEEGKLVAAASYSQSRTAGSVSGWGNQMLSLPRTALDSISRYEIVWYEMESE